MKRSALVAAFCLVVPLAAQAQSKALEDKKAVSYNEIERGFFFEASGGFWATLNPPVSGTSKQYLTPGQSISAQMGYDIGERVSPYIFLTGASNRAGSDYTGRSGGLASGDFSEMIPGIGAKVRLVGFDDVQGVARTWIYARAAAGLVFYSPAQLLPTNDVLISVGPGVEYFTRLRHFSVCFEANFNILALTGSFGFSVMPSVRYAF
jgi:hypothetical protein